MEYMYITNQPEIAAIADEAGIDRVWVDLERLGKEERQKGYDSVKSDHKIDDICKLKQIVKKSKVQVRINPINCQSRDEIEKVIEAGADMIMLPYYKTLREVEIFLSCVKNRVGTILLLETKGAVSILEDTLNYSEANEIHIGLNDLHLEYHKKFMFELLADGTLDSICEKIKASGRPFGFGGIAGLGRGELPAEYILGEHVRLGSTRAILSRSFLNTTQHKDMDVIYEIIHKGMKELRAYEQALHKKDSCFFEDNKKALKERVEQIAYGSK